MGFEEIIPIAKLIGEIGVGIVMSGVVIFVLIYMLRVALPDIVDRHLKQVGEMVTRHKEESKLTREDHKAESKQTRDDYKESLKSVIDHCQRESSMRDDIMRREVAENTAAIMDLRRTLEDLRESLADDRIDRNKARRANSSPPKPLPPT